VAARTPGLTLLELLVACAILALLASLLVSTAGRALEEARQVECRGHLRHLGVGLLGYAKDHDGLLPVSAVVDGPHPALVQALKTYVDDPRIYYCPSETAEDRLYSAAAVESGRIGYFYYACERPTPNRLVSTFLRWNVAWPRRLCTGGAARAWVASDAWFSGLPTAHRFEKKGVNYLTLSGDVQTVTESPREAFE
jgi:prepilin-type N-terminal cleavage/methylation domain-containing protein